MYLSPASPATCSNWEVGREIDSDRQLAWVSGIIPSVMEIAQPLTDAHRWQQTLSCNQNHYQRWKLAGLSNGHRTKLALFSALVANKDPRNPQLTLRWEIDRFTLSTTGNSGNSSAPMPRT